MNAITLFRFITTLALLIVVSANASAAGSCSLAVGWSPYGSYIFVNQAGGADGVDIELMKVLAEEIGCEVTFKELPWARHLLEMKAGRIDVATSVRRSPERETFGWFSDPYRENQMALYVRRGETANYALDHLEDIARIGFKLGIVDDYYYGPLFTKLMERPDFARQVEKIVDYETLIRMLVYGRIDGVLTEDVEVLISEARAIGLYDRIEAYPLSIPGGTFHLMFSKQSVDPAIVTMINTALAQMKTDGRLQRIFYKYLK